MENTNLLLSCALTAITITVYLIRWYLNPINAIPTVGGPSLPLLSYLGAINFIRRGNEVIMEGYRKHYDGVFKIAMLDQWFVVVNGVDMVEDVRLRPESELSAREGIGEFTRTAHTLGRIYHHDPYHSILIQDRLTRSIPRLLDAVADEVVPAVHDLIPAKDGWVDVILDERIKRTMARISNCAYVRLPSCRDEDYIRHVAQFTFDVARDRIVGINNFLPDFLLTAGMRKTFSAAAATVASAIPLLAPTIDKRRSDSLLEKVPKHGAEKPNDMLQWIMEEAASRTGTDEEIVTRIFLVNYASVHTFTIVFKHAILQLAENPLHAEAIRAQTEPLAEAEGWTKASLAKMTKLDAFLKESQRFNGSDLFAMLRKTMDDVRLLDGTLIPAGTLMATSQFAVHHDGRHYPNPETFDPSRWERGAEDAFDGRKQFVSTSQEYLGWGHGKYACPGRFFAAAVLKIMLAHILLNYDLKFEDGTKRPANIFWASSIRPPDAKILFKARSRPA